METVTAAVAKNPRQAPKKTRQIPQWEICLKRCASQQHGACFKTHMVTLIPFSLSSQNLYFQPTVIFSKKSTYDFFSQGYIFKR